MFKFIATTNPADITDPAHTLGIEVTDSATLEVLRRTGRSTYNIDGQHGTGAGSWDGVAVDQWLELPLGSAAGSAAVAIATHVHIPANGTTFLTTRPDLDSIGAMAVLVIRGAGLWPAMGSDTENAFRDRVRAVAEADAFTPSAAWSPSPLPTEENPWPRAGSVDSSQGLAHLGMICSPRRGDLALPLAERVALIACWLLFGEPLEDVDGDGVWPHDRGEIRTIRDACGCPEGREFTHLANAFLSARERVLVSRRALATEAQKSGAVVFVNHDGSGGDVSFCEGLSGDVAIVRVSHAGAMGLGYCVAPVVIAFDQANPGKVTIAAYAARYLDVAPLKARLNEAELAERVAASTCANGGDFQEHADARLAAFHAGDAWGGGATIVGSPQNGGTKLNESTILEAVRSCCL